VYAKRSSYKCLPWHLRLWNKLLKMIIQHCPSNGIRIKALRLSGFDIGEKVYVGQDLIIASPISEKSCGLIIGDRVAIGPRVTIVLSSDANWSNLMDTREYIKSNVLIGDDSWIGACVTILPGVTIGRMSIVGAGAVVNRNVPDYSVVAGVPARVISSTITDNTLTNELSK